MEAAIIRQAYKTDYKWMKRKFKTIKPFLLKNGYPIEYHYRLKSVNGIEEKLKANKQLDDIIGFRITHPWTKNLHQIKDLIRNNFPELNITKEMITEKNRVIYLFGQTKAGHLFEIQLWPSLIYTCFEYEHDLIYKGKNITPALQVKSESLRIKQHQLQDIIDKSILVPYLGASS